MSRNHLNRPARPNRTVPLCLGLLAILFTGLPLMAAGNGTVAERPSAPLDVSAIPADAVCRNPAASPADRAASLLGYMNQEEKIGQMTQPARDYLRSDRDIAAWALGSVLSGGGSGPSANNPKSWADMYDRYQQAALKSRLAIPIIYGVDAVHGHNNVRGAVIFPHNIGLGATRDAELVEQIGRVTAREVAATGINWTFAPCLAVPQDPRWGRTYEGFSEDPAIVSQLGAASVRGLQGTEAGSLAKPGYVLACIKHFAGDGGTTGGVDRGNTEVDEATFRDRFVFPYKASIEAGAQSVMVSFSSWNGLKMHQNKYLVTDVLKGELGFGGLVVSDWAGIKENTGNPATQIAQGINAGIDLVMVPDNYTEFCATLLDLVKAGTVPQSRIDDAVRRILTVKFKLGLFERPYADRSLLAEVGSAEHRALARRAVAESQVILKNEGVLPLSRAAKSVVVTGSAASDIGLQCGGWTISWQGLAGAITPGTTVFKAIQKAAGAGAAVSFERDAARIARADLVVVVSAEAPYAEMKGDSPAPAFASADLAAIKALKAKNLKVLTILMSGRPILINEAIQASDAFIASFLPGTEADGIADIVFGAARPRGKLAFTWPASVDAIPVHGDKPGPGILFPRGFGLDW